MRNLSQFDLLPLTYFLRLLRRARDFNAVVEVLTLLEPNELEAKERGSAGGGQQPESPVQLYAGALVFSVHASLFASVMEEHIPTLFRAMVTTAAFRQMPHCVARWFIREQRRSSERERASSAWMRMHAAPNVLRFAAVCLTHALERLTPSADAAERDAAQHLLLGLFAMCEAGVVHMGKLLSATTHELISQSIACATADASRGILGDGVPTSLALAILDKLFEVSGTPRNDAAKELRLHLVSSMPRFVAKLRELAALYAHRGGADAERALRVCLRLPVAGQLAVLAEKHPLVVRHLLHTCVAATADPGRSIAREALPVVYNYVVEGECSLFTVTFYANLAHSLTRSP